MRDSSPSEQALAARAVNPDRFADDDDDAPSKGRQALGSRLSDAARRRAGAAKRHVEAVAQSPVGAAALGAVVAYVAVRGTLEVFHRSRRAFLRQLLLDLCPALEALGQTYWLDFGCLLGVHREGDLLLHDNDVDLAVLNPNWPQLLQGLRAALPPKYTVKVVTPAGSPESAWLRVYCPLGMADLFGAYDDGSGAQVYVDCGHGDTMHIDKALVLPPGRKTWRGATLRVPADVEGTLARRYGPTWRTPRYLDKGADDIEASKPYARLFRALARLGIRV